MEKRQAPEKDEIAILIEKAGAGDRPAFKSIVTTYQQKIFLLAFSFLRNREDAQDVVQETFMRLYQKLEVYDREKDFQSWLLQIAKNLCIDYYRKNISKRRAMESNASLDGLNLAAPRGESDPEDADLREVFSRGLARLGERQRLVFVMKHYNGLDYREIAQVMSISLGTVKSLHFKAVQNLRSLLSPQLGLER
jgi:RNA polymerase sigma-70 factor (ECF subfamily)